VTTAPAPAAGVPSTNANGAPVSSPQEIIVTGSRIPQPNLETASPVTTVSSQEVKLQGTTRTEDLINSLPQVFADQGSNVSNGATGTAEIDLRGLGAKRSMVLINGRRLMPGDPTDPNPDINFIPNQLIKRVDVLTGGASSVYGADAVAGVVNFVLDDNFTGFRIDGQASVFNHQNGGISNSVKNALSNSFWNAIGIPTPPFQYPRGMSTNGGAQDISAVFGASFDDGRGHVQAYATYRHQDPVLESTRDYSFCALGAFQPQYVASYGELYCGGSATSAQGTFFVNNPVTGGTFHVSGNKLVPGLVLFNFAPYNYYQRPDERYTFGGFANYEIAPGAKPYLEAMFMDDHSDALIAPGGDFGDTTTVNCDNPLMSDQERGIICPGFTFDANNPQFGSVQILRRNVEGGGRDDILDHHDFRVVAGMRGDPWKGISYDTYYQFGRATLNDQTNNFFSKSRLAEATDAVSVLNGVIVAPGTPGATVECRSVFNNTDPNCVPYNLFLQGGVTQDQLNFLQVPAFASGNVDETIAHGDVTFTGSDYGLQTPWSDTGLGLNVGVEYRKELLRYNTDLENQTGDLSGGSGTVPSVAGQFDVREFFGELQVPIVEHSFIDELSVTGGYRHSVYHIGGNSKSTDTYKVEARFAPIKDVRFRGSYNRAVRAPNIVELFQPQRSFLSGSIDPCAGPVGADGTVNGFTAAQCANSGVTAAQFGNILPSPAKQYNAVGGGNVNLNPETADTWTAGVILQPRFIPGLALTADWFKIKVKDVIGTIPWNTIASTCVTTGTLCDLIHRDQFGSLWRTQNGFINVQNANVGELDTKGFDFQGTYNHRLGAIGTMNVSFVGTYLKELFSAFPGSDVECAGFYGGSCGTPNPKWRHKLRVGLTMPNGMGVSAQWRYFGSTDLFDRKESSPPADLHLSSISYFDLAFTARMAQKLNLRLGVNNIFDKDPPLTELGANGNTYPQTYDAMGRYMFAGFTVDF
jgi:iron complex outermembrane receptor protein